jgi:transcriptional regulatory protein RtcR
VKKLVVIGLIGTTLDAIAAFKEERWSKWRPSISLCQHEELLISRFELLYDPWFEKLASQTKTDMELVSPETKVRLHPISVKDWWDFSQVYTALLDFSQNNSFDTDTEEYLVHITTGSHVAQICLFLLTESHWLPGKILQSEPPRRNNKVGSYKIIDLDLSKYDAIASRFRQTHTQAISFLKHGIETKNSAFNHLIERIEEVAVRSKDPMLITGPTGAGKSQLARKIFELKKARQLVTGAFVEVNSATLRGDQAMSALFGHIKGAFTGAGSDRPGLLRKADGGVLFLDEIGDLNPDEQAMLLRALEEKCFLPVGADTEVHSDFQLIAGTNHDLISDVRSGKFREDLLARINLWTFRLPSLRERIEDVEPNLDYELEQYAHTTGQHITLSKEAREKLLSFSTLPESLWSGNFRDLNGAVRRLATLSRGGRITTELVDEEINRLKQLWQPKEDQQGNDTLKSLLGVERFSESDRFDRVQLLDVIEVCRKSRSISEAGRLLFSVSRKNKRASNDADRLRKYLSKFGLTWGNVQERGQS